MVGSLDLLILIFMDYLFAINMGIDVKGMFLSSFGGFTSNIFTLEFFTIIIGLVLLFIVYYLVFPIMFPIIIYRIIALIYGFLLILFLGIPIKIWNLLFRNYKIELDLSFQMQLKLAKMIKVDDLGNIIPNKRTDLFLEIYKDVNGEGKIEDFYVYLSKVVIAISIIAISLHCTIPMIILLGLISLIPLIFACAFFNFYLNMNEITETMNKLRPNLTPEQLIILDGKPLITNQEIEKVSQKG